MANAVGAAHWKKGAQMRYKAIFIAGVAVGFVAGTRAGRGVYDKMAGAGQYVASHPKVQQATNAAQVKATDMAKSAAAKAPSYAKNAAATAAKTAQAQVPKYVSSAKQKLPARFGGTSDDDASGADPAADGAAAGAQDDISPDGHVVYPVDGTSPSANGIRYTPDTP